MCIYYHNKKQVRLNVSIWCLAVRLRTALYCDRVLAEMFV